MSDDTLALRDRAQIIELPHRYARGIDTYDTDLVLSLFAEGAFVDGSRASLPYRDYYRSLTANIAYYKCLMHYMSNEIVEVDGDKGRIHTYCQAYHWSAESLATNAEADLRLGVVYADDVARIDGRWLITYRKVYPRWRVGSYHPQWT